mgnify:CR=1 FL=1
MWKQGAIGVRAENGRMVSVTIWVKKYGEPSEEYGISGGRISKLMLKQDGRVVYNYDRGEDIKPQTSEAEKALAILIHEYN